QLPSASYLLRGRPSGLVGPGPSQQRHDLLHLGELLELARVLGVPFATLVAGIDAADEQLAEA
ncbi:hypothetical protein ACIQLJ_18265, partial [Microbacterium sp. NPDC091313]